MTLECTCPDCGETFSAQPSGGHRLVCGDSTVAADVTAVLGGVAPHLMVTDPPYGVDYDPAWRARAGVNSELLAYVRHIEARSDSKQHMD